MRLNTLSEAVLGAVVMLLSGCGGDTLEPLPSKFQMIDAGNIHSCGIVTDGQAFCWGNNDFGQLGDGSRRSRVYPVPVVGAVRYATLSGGTGHTCAIATDESAYCWGFNLNGQLGDGTTEDHAVPAPVTGSFSWVTLSAGGSYTCGVATDSLAYCWGWNAFGQVGDGSNTDRLTPTAVSGGHKFQAVKANAHHTCGLTFAGEAYCWGYNAFGQIGNNDTASSTTPQLVGGGMTWTAVDVGLAHSCGIAADGMGYCWGRNQYGQLGDSDSTGSSESLPVAMAGGLFWESLNLGAYFSCGVEDGSGAAYCWGYNGSGQLGGNAPGVCADADTQTLTQCALSPFAVSGGLIFGSISAHTQHTCGLSVDGVAYCWGSGRVGQLGNGQKGDQVFTIEPVRVAGQP